jgi:hypothetical protein
LKLEDGLTNLDQFVKEHVGEDQRSQPRLLLYFDVEGEVAVFCTGIVLNHLKEEGWNVVDGINGIVDKVGFLRGEYFGDVSGKGRDMCSLDRTNNGEVTSCRVKYKGESDPPIKRDDQGNPLDRMTQRQWAVAKALLDDALKGVELCRQGKAKLLIS